MQAADTETDRHPEAGVIDGGAVGVHRHAVQPGIVGSLHRYKGPEIDLGSRHRDRRLAASEDSGPPVLREQRADSCKSRDRSDEIQNILLRTDIRNPARKPQLQV